MNLYYLLFLLEPQVTVCCRKGNIQIKKCISSLGMLSITVISYPEIKSIPFTFDILSSLIAACVGAMSLQIVASSLVTHSLGHVPRSVFIS